MKCRLCRKKMLLNFLDFGDMPIVKNLKDSSTNTDKLYSFKLVQCSSCGFIQVEKPISPLILYKNYINLSSSKRQPHITRLLEVLEQITGANKKSRILDIGCNDGSFLLKLRSKGFTNLCGIEPAEDAFIEARRRKLHLHHGFFNFETAKQLYKKQQFDIVIARQVLEHITNLNDFISGISYILKENGVICFELPDFLWNAEYLDYSLWEEHVNYFCLETLRNLLKLHNFDIFHSETTLFSGRALIVFCKKCKFKNIKLNVPLNNNISRYKKTFLSYKANLTKFLSLQNNKIYIYGCGTRSSNFVNFLNTSNYISGFIDDNIAKQNKYVPLCNLPVEKWNSIKHKNSTILLGCNTENENFIKMKRGFYSNNVFSICPPSRLIPDFWIKLYNNV